MRGLIIWLTVAVTLLRELIRACAVPLRLMCYLPYRHRWRRADRRRGRIAAQPVCGDADLAAPDVAAPDVAAPDFAAPDVAAPGGHWWRRSVPQRQQMAGWGAVPRVAGGSASPRTV